MAPAETGANVARQYGTRARDILMDLLDFTGMASRLIARGKESYDADEALQLAAEAITHRVGEAVARLPEDFLVDYPDVEWRKMQGLRRYMRVDRELVWNALAARLPEVGNYVRSVLTDEPPPPS